MTWVCITSVINFAKNKIWHNDAQNTSRWVCIRLWPPIVVMRRHTRQSAHRITLLRKCSCRQDTLVLVTGGHSALSCMKCWLVSDYGLCFKELRTFASMTVCHSFVGRDNDLNMWRHRRCTSSRLVSHPYELRPFFGHLFFKQASVEVTILWFVQDIAFKIWLFFKVWTAAVCSVQCYCHFIYMSYKCKKLNSLKQCLTATRPTSRN